MAKFFRELTAQERFEAFVMPVPEAGCWLWIGGEMGGPRGGYGSFWNGEKNVRATRFAIELYTGAPVPAGLHVCHKCDTPLCVNPSHLFIGTAGDNIRDCRAKGRHAEASKTHCIRGHEYNEKNTYYYPQTGRRYCKICSRERNLP